MHKLLGIGPFRGLWLFWVRLGPLPGQWRFFGFRRSGAPPGKSIIIISIISIILILIINLSIIIISILILIILIALIILKTGVVLRNPP